MNLTLTDLVKAQMDEYILEGKITGDYTKAIKYREKVLAFITEQEKNQQGKRTR